jgi:hypothetical protein
MATSPAAGVPTSPATGVPTQSAIDTCNQSGRPCWPPREHQGCRPRRDRRGRRCCSRRGVGGAASGWRRGRQGCGHLVVGAGGDALWLERERKHNELVTARSRGPAGIMHSRGHTARVAARTSTKVHPSPVASG